MSKTWLTVVCSCLMVSTLHARSTVEIQDWDNQELIYPGDTKLTLAYYCSIDRSMYNFFRMRVVDPGGNTVYVHQDVSTGMYDFELNLPYDPLFGEWAFYLEGTKKAIDDPLGVTQPAESIRHTRGLPRVHIDPTEIRMWHIADVDAIDILPAPVVYDFGFDQSSYEGRDTMTISWDVGDSPAVRSVKIVMMKPMYRFPQINEDFDKRDPHVFEHQTTDKVGTYTYALPDDPITGQWTVGIWVLTNSFGFSLLQTDTAEVSGSGPRLDVDSRVFDAQPLPPEGAVVDEDRDGISDDYEHTLAHSFAPTIHLDFEELISQGAWDQDAATVTLGKLLDLINDYDSWEFVEGKGRNGVAVYYKCRPTRSEPIADGVFDALEIQYWFISSFNTAWAEAKIPGYDWTDTHEWEAEHIAVKVFNTGRGAMPAEVYYSVHASGDLYTWQEGWPKHPTVYTAAGSHGSHKDPGVTEYDAADLPPPFYFDNVIDKHRGGGGIYSIFNDTYTLYNLGSFSHRFDGQAGAAYSHPGMSWVHDREPWPGWFLHPPEQRCPYGPFDGGHDVVKVTPFGQY